MLVYNSAFVLTALGLFELYLAVSPPVSEISHEGRYSTIDYVRDDPDLGYSISPQSRIWSSKLKAPDGSTICDVKYRINQYDCGDDTNEKWVAQRLEQNGVPTLRLSLSLSALKSDGFRFPFDRHPTANAYILVASALDAFLNANRLAAHGVARHMLQP